MKERGFTLIETVIAIGIGSIITLGAILTIYQVTHNTSRSNSHLLAVNEISRIVVQLKRDLQSYQTANLSDLQNGSSTFTWTNLSGFEPFEERDHYVTYSLSGNTLYREADNETFTLGRNVDSMVFSGDDESVEVTIVVTSDNYPPKSENFTFTVFKRSGLTIEE